MINVVGRVDLAASSGATVWHRASALSKLLFALLLLLVVVFTRSLPLLVALHLMAWTLALSSRLSPRVILTMLGYPLLFTGLFVVATWDGTWVTPVRLLLRPTTACLTAVWLVATTPYPDLFAPISRVLPGNVADGLFITYRALFDLMDRSERLMRALRLRGGVSGRLRQRLTASGESLGTLVLHSFDRSERMYAAMLIRGHSGRICGCRHYAEMTRADLWVAGGAAVTVALALALGGLR
jgi:cobalt/nickel transport system permease protein